MKEDNMRPKGHYFFHAKLEGTPSCITTSFDYSHQRNNTVLYATKFIHDLRIKAKGAKLPHQTAAQQF